MTSNSDIPSDQKSVEVNCDEHKPEDENNRDGAVHDVEELLSAVPSRSALKKGSIPSQTERRVSIADVVEKIQENADQFDDDDFMEDCAGYSCEPVNGLDGVSVSVNIDAASCTALDGLAPVSNEVGSIDISEVSNVLPNAAASVAASLQNRADRKKTREERKKEREKKKEEEMLKKYHMEQEAKQKASARSKCGRWIKHNLKIGEGGYKFVYRGYDRQEALNIAWCEFKREHVDTKEKRNAMFRETEIMLKMDHPHIVRCFDVFSEWINVEDPNNTMDEKGLVIIQELMGEGTLKSVIRKNFQAGQCILKFPLITRWWHQIIDALRYMHSGMMPPILHRDLKAENCFVYGASDEEYLNVKVGDFGLATHVNRSGRKTMLGTLGFMAPEIFDEKYDEQVDIYAFGMLMLEVMTNRTPYDECETLIQVAAKTMTGKGPQVMQMVSDQGLREVIVGCIHPLTCYRPTAEELFHHPLFQPKPLPVEVEPNYDKESDREEVISRFVKSLAADVKKPCFNLRLRFRDKRMLQELGLDDGESLEFDLDIYKAEDQDIPDLIQNLRTEYEDKLSRVFENPKQPEKKIVTTQLDRLFTSITHQMRYLVKVLLGRRWSEILADLVAKECGTKAAGKTGTESEDDEEDLLSTSNFAIISEYKSKWNRAKKALDREIVTYRASKKQKKAQVTPSLLTQLQQVQTSVAQQQLQGSISQQQQEAQQPCSQSQAYPQQQPGQNSQLQSLSNTSQLAGQAPVSIECGVPQIGVQPPSVVTSEMATHLYPQQRLDPATAAVLLASGASYGPGSHVLANSDPSLFTQQLGAAMPQVNPAALQAAGYPSITPNPDHTQGNTIFSASQGSVFTEQHATSTHAGAQLRKSLSEGTDVLCAPLAPYYMTSTAGTMGQSGEDNKFDGETVSISEDTSQQKQTNPVSGLAHTNSLMTAASDITATQAKGERKGKKKNKQKGKYLLRITDMKEEEEGGGGSTLRLTFYMQMPDHSNTNGPQGTWKLTFRCNLLDTTEDFKIPVFEGSRDDSTRDSSDIDRALKETVTLMLQSLCTDITSIPLNEDYLFFPLPSRQGVTVLQRFANDSSGLTNTGSGAGGGLGEQMDEDGGATLTTNGDETSPLSEPVSRQMSTEEGSRGEPYDAHSVMMEVAHSVSEPSIAASSSRSSSPPRYINLTTSHVDNALFSPAEVSPDNTSFVTALDETELILTPTSTTLSPVEFSDLVPKGFELVEEEDMLRMEETVAESGLASASLTQESGVTQSNTDGMVNVTLSVPLRQEKVLRDLASKLRANKRSSLVVVPCREDQSLRILEVPEHNLFIGVPKGNNAGFSVIKGPKEKAFVVAQENLESGLSAPRIYQAPEDGAVILTPSGEIQYVEKPTVVVPPQSPQQRDVRVRELPIALDDSLSFDDVIMLMETLKNMSLQITEADRRQVSILAEPYAVTSIAEDSVSSAAAPPGRTGQPNQLALMGSVPLFPAYTPTSSQGGQPACTVPHNSEAETITCSSLQGQPTPTTTVQQQQQQQQKVLLINSFSDTQTPSTSLGSVGSRFHVTRVEEQKVVEEPKEVEDRSNGASRFTVTQSPVTAVPASPAPTAVIGRFVVTHAPSVDDVDTTQADVAGHNLTPDSQSIPPLDIGDDVT